MIEKYSPMVAMAALLLAAIGTIIHQGETPAHYFAAFIVGCQSFIILYFMWEEINLP